MRARTAVQAGAILAALSTLACSAGGSSSTQPPAGSPTASATPVRDPTAHGTTLDISHPDPGVDRTAVKLTRSPSGGVKVLEFLSPDLTEAEKRDLRAAIERGEVRPDWEPERPASVWTTTVIRKR